MMKNFSDFDELYMSLTPEEFHVIHESESFNEYTLKCAIHNIDCRLTVQQFVNIWRCISGLDYDNYRFWLNQWKT